MTSPGLHSEEAVELGFEPRSVLPLPQPCALDLSATRNGVESPGMGACPGLPPWPSVPPLLWLRWCGALAGSARSRFSAGFTQALGGTFSRVQQAPGPWIGASGLSDLGLSKHSQCCLT